jgi:ATP adenylyltransferase/5',5'''-P-1,P-4-tetraphosphate phosphorylase II
VVTKDWMMMVNRSRPYYGQSQIQINSLGYLGLLYAKDSSQLSEISEKSPLEILNSLAMPVISFTARNEATVPMKK